MSTDVIISVVIFGALACFFYFIGTLVGSVVEDRDRSRRFQKFSQDLKTSILTGKMVPADVQHLMNLHRIDDSGLLQALRQHLSDSLSDPAKDKDEPEKFRKYINWHADERPFSELPENVRIQMESLKNDVPEVTRRLRDLATSLTDLYQKNQREIKKQGRYAFWGIVIGIVGIILAVVFGVLSIPSGQKPPSTPLASVRFVPL